LASVINGKSIGTTLPRFIRGNLAVSDSSNFLLHLIKSQPDARSHLLWLLDDLAGLNMPAPPVFPETENGDIGFQYLRKALQAAFAKRIDNHQCAPQIIPIDFREVQAQWTHFLRQQEEEFPGIHGLAKLIILRMIAARNSILWSEKNRREPTSHS
jgi:hypothetical protein